MSNKVAPPKPRATIDILDDKLLAELFLAVPAAERRQLAVVCRRWRSVCDNTLHIWDDMELNFSGGAVTDSSAMYRWFVKKRGAVRRLLLVAETEEDWMVAHLVLGLLAGDLEQLIVRAGLEGLNMPSVAWMPVLHHLRVLHLDYDAPDLLEVCAAFPPGLEELVVQPVSGSRKFLGGLPPGLAKLTRLRTLSLRSLHLASMSGSFPHHHSMTVLSSLTALERLELLQATLSTLPPHLSALTQLVCLNLSGSSMDRDGWTPLAALSGLQELNLQTNYLTKLPEPVAALPGLRRLVLAGNVLATLPDGPYLAGLSALDISCNRFKELPLAMLSSCTGLRLLRLEGCKPAGGKPGGRMALTAKTLRQLLSNNSGIRELSVSADAGIGTNQLAQLRFAFPQVSLTEVDTSEELLAPSSNESEEWEGSEEESEGSEDYESSSAEGHDGDEMEDREHHGPFVAQHSEGNTNSGEETGDSEEGSSSEGE